MTSTIQVIKVGETRLWNSLARSNTAEFKTLFPDDYLVRLEKPGYYTWAKKLTVQSKLTTFANNVYTCAPQSTLKFVEEV